MKCGMNTPGQKYAILGDVHSNLEALTSVLDDARNQGCTQFACVGDLVGYNANPRECLELIRNLGVSCVKGNHDEYASMDEYVPGLSPRAASSMAWTRVHLDEEDKAWLGTLKHVRVIDGFAIVHASLDGPDRWPYVFERLGAASHFNYQHTGVCFYGHTHLPMVFIRDHDIRGSSLTRFTVDTGRQYLVNVGSVGEPRDGTGLASYVVYDTSSRQIELRRVPYEAAATEAKLREAGLPPRRRP